MMHLPSGASGERAAVRIERQLARRENPLALPLALVVLIGLVTGALIGLDYQQQHDLWRSRLTSLAEIRATGVELWLRERRADAALIASFPTPRRLAVHPDAADPEVQEQLPEVLERVRARSAARGVGLVVGGREVVTAGEPLSRAAVARLGRALAGAETETVGLEIRPEGELRVVAAARIEVETAAPAFAAITHAPGDDLGRLVSPTFLLTRSGEVLLVAPHERYLVLFAGLRFHDQELRFIPAELQDERLAARRALEAPLSYGELRDYRGQRVLAATKRLQGADWGLVVKVDYPEAYAAWRANSWRTALAGLGLATLAVGLVTAAARTRRRRHLAQLVLSEERLRLALAAASQGLWDLDVPSGEAVVDAGYARMLGYDPGGFTETNQKFLDRLHPEDRPGVEAAYSDYLEGRRTRYWVECRQRTATGGWKWILSTGAAVEWDAAGRPLRMLGTHVDIDRRRRAEEELRSLASALEERVRERTAELEAANRELESFSHSVSHDLRAPLRAIDGFSRLLEEEHARGIDEEGLRLLGVVRANTRRMGQLIDDLLAFSRAGRQELRRARVESGALVESVLAELLPAQRRASLELDVGPLPAVEGDPGLLRQVWQNLLDNAIKFTSNRPRARIAVRGERRDQFVELAVSDDGVGFDPRYVDKLFGVFQRLHAATEFPGTGVGLALVRRIVERHGGTVGASGAPGKGATFTFTLPAAGEGP